MKPYCDDGKGIMIYRGDVFKTSKLPCMIRKEIASLGGKAGCASRWGKKCVI